MAVITIFGASGATGLHACAQALEAGHTVRAADHDGDHPLQGRDDFTVHQADVLKDDLTALVDGADAVLSCLGVGNDLGTLASPPPLYSRGTDRICDAMEPAGCKRLIVISASFVEEKNRGPIWFKLPAMTGLIRVFEQMAEMEANLHKRTNLDWTAVRAGWLMEGDITRDYTVQANVIPEDMVRTRHADLAHFMLHLAEGKDWLHQTPALARPEDASATSPAAVARDMVA
ncbi:NAD(P)-dependent oxidoreductase [uncultured Tateyamaria sp.]|uniref:NAD(P)-dependent oxidoreductase n=1 Tax=uncultured Tateyamaria sp. TaxID=455651 RepID=UPI002609585D|nr:NAD(P)H-binding protein [uncultured Tateyamaria sp.]